jgi:hypothetical protein
MLGLRVLVLFSWLGSLMDSRAPRPGRGGVTGSPLGSSLRMNPDTDQITAGHSLAGIRQRGTPRSSVRGPTHSTDSHTA